MQTGLVSVIILNWNSKDTIFECLDSLFKQTYPTFEVIVVDNASRDGSPQIIQEKYGNSIRFIQNEKNFGFSGGVNRGLKAAQGEFIALLNSDAYADPNWLEQLVKGVRSSGFVGMCACKIYLAAEKNILDNTGEVICKDGHGSARGRFEEDRGQYDSSYDVLCPSGCAAIYRKQIFDATGGLDEKFFAYMEDVEIGIKARMLGYTARYIPKAIVYHHLSRHSSVISTKKAYLIERNRLWMVIKCFPASHLVLSFFYTFCRYFFHFIGIFVKRGPSKVYAQRFGAWSMIWSVIKTHFVTVWMLPYLLKERKKFQNKSIISAGDFTKMLKRYSVSPKQAAFRDSKNKRHSLY